MIVIEKNTDYSANYSTFDPNLDARYNDYLSRDPMLNPMLQYEQAYMYYRYLTAQMDYKIKCKEYDKLCHQDTRNERGRIVE